MRKLLEEYNDVTDLKEYNEEKMQQMAYEIRKFLVENVSKTGGHLASNLGVVELTLSMFKVFNMKEDKIVWDVGHQAYVHKILTGRKEEFEVLRKYGGLSGFPKITESEYDAFGTGHSSTSISAALGIARARDILNEDINVVSVIGDGALTGGMALEALNDLGYNNTKMIVILNDNEMSISENVGVLSSYLGKLRVSKEYVEVKGKVKSSVGSIPLLGKHLQGAIHKVKDGVKQIVIPGGMFENFGMHYVGPVDGHDMQELCRVFEWAKQSDDPILIHVVTKKGEGYKFAEENPQKFHGVAPFDPKTGELYNKSKKRTYSKALGDSLVKIAKEDEKVVAITAAMLRAQLP